MEISNEDKIATLELVLEYSKSDLQKMETGVLNSADIPKIKATIKQLEDRIALIKDRENL